MAAEFLKTTDVDFLLLRADGSRLILRKIATGSPCGVTGLVSSIQADTGAMNALAAGSGLAASINGDTGQVGSLSAKAGEQASVNAGTGIGRC